MSPFVRMLCRFAAVAAMLASLSAAADPPARVGRLSLAEGSVTFRINRQDPGNPASYNWPVSGGALLDTGPDGRAEVQVGSSVFRLGGDSSVEFTALDDSQIALQVWRGALAANIRDRDQADQIDVGTPTAQVRFAGPGRYRVDVDDQGGNTRVASRQGTAYVYRAGEQIPVPDGQRVVIAEGGWIQEVPRRDGFDAWVDARDAAGDTIQSLRYVSPEMTGYEDLDRYGQWTSVPDYGAVWYPWSVPADWAPYRYGRWAWVPPWGWTWVDQAPWGFAPFHYGRWLFLDGRWAWAPGGYIRRPVYAPALVAWIGDPGGGFGGLPAVGWFPLAPREVFIPAYRCSPGYIRRANINQGSSPAAINQALADPRPHRAFANRALPQAVTVVAADVLRSGAAISQAHVLRPDHRDLARAPVSHRVPDPVRGAATPVPPAAAPALFPPRTGHAFSPVENRPVRRQAPPVVAHPAFPAGAAIVAPPAGRPVSPEPAPAIRRHDRPEVPRSAPRPFLPPPLAAPVRPAAVTPTLPPTVPAPREIAPSPTLAIPQPVPHMPAIREPREPHHAPGNPPHAR
ncbi:MAG TPA: DUF6600 domain-containing protein [Rhodocyclaceae bacterium]|nr:DUF6600 domain-containing protein [Rhodocyclaceae bacterium]